MKNTVIELMYRDAGNYKTYRTEIISGRISSDDWHEIIGTLDMGENFVAEQVGLRQPEAESALDPELDHGFTCLAGTDSKPRYTDEKPTVAITADELVDHFLSVRHWNPMLGANFID